VRRAIEYVRARRRDAGWAREARLPSALIDLAAGRPPRDPRVDDRLTDLAVDHRLTGLVWNWLRDHRAVEPALQASIAMRDLAVQAHHARVWAALETSVERLHDAGIDVLAVKGVTAESRWYGRTGERPCADVDLLLPPHELPRATEAVAALQPEHPWLPELDRMVIGGRVQGVTLEADGVDVDLHFDLLKVGVPMRGAHDLWVRSRRFRLPSGREVRVLDDTGALFHLLIHLNKDRFHRLLGYADIARLLVEGNVDLELLERDARREGLEVPAACTLQTVLDELELPQPPGWTRPRGWRVAVWDRLWPRRVHLLGGTEGEIRHRMRHNWIAVLARGRTAEACWSWLRSMWPPAATVEMHYGSIRGPYLWKLLRGRLEASARRRAARSELRGTGRGRAGGAMPVTDRPPVATTSQPSARGGTRTPWRSQRHHGRWHLGREEGAVVAERLATVPVARAPDVFVQQLPSDRILILNLATEVYHALDPVGAAMWSTLLDAGRIGTAIEHLLSEFDTDAETLSRDLGALVLTLEARGLLVVGDDAVGRSDLAG
jgi:hypothetical protein